MRQKFVTKCVTFFITKCSSVIRKRDSCYKMRRLLQTATEQHRFAKPEVLGKTVKWLKNYTSLSPFKSEFNEYQGFLETWWLKISPHCDSEAFRQLSSIHIVVYWNKWILKKGHCKVFLKNTSEVQLKYTQSILKV